MGCSMSNGIERRAAVSIIAFLLQEDQCLLEEEKGRARQVSNQVVYPLKKQYRSTKDRPALRFLYPSEVSVGTEYLPDCSDPNIAKTMPKH